MNKYNSTLIELPFLNKCSYTRQILLKVLPAKSMFTNVSIHVKPYR